MNSNSNKSPQLSGGYTQIANELLEAVSLYPFTGGELKTVLVIMRLTYGYKRKMSNISLTEISKRTGLSRRHVSNVLKRLRGSSVINSAKFNNRNLLGIHKDYSRWKLWISNCPEMPDFTSKLNGSSLGNELGFADFGDL